MDKERYAMDVLAKQKKCIDSLVHLLEAAEGSISQFETHISRVLVAGKYAFKFKKAVHLAFLDFSTLEARRFYCMEECRLNRRLASHIYLDVVPVTGDPEHPVLNGTGVPIEYAVRMHAFEQQALWSHRIAHGLVTAGDVDDLASKTARFHLDAAIAPADSDWGTAQAIAATSDETLAELSDLFKKDDGKRERVADLQRWEAGQRLKLTDTFNSRKAQGMIRECHGDLHCGNVLTTSSGVEVFDCIEFSDKLRWIDVMNDLAFICMDLAFRRRADLAARLLNQYLEVTGDHQGLAVLRYYQVHRALVRSKVMLLQAGQRDTPAQDMEECTRSGLAYLAFAERHAQPQPTAIMITHGYSGSGKTTFSSYVVELLGAVQLRSDVERKRMHGLAAATGRAVASPGAQLYSAAATQMTYERLLTLARCVVDAGWPVIIDAAFLKASQRQPFHSLALEIGVPFFIFDMQASEPTMRSRIASREAAGLDASDAGMEVLERQLRNDEPFAAAETAHRIAVDMESEMDLQRARSICAPVEKIIFRGHD